MVPLKAMTAIAYLMKSLLNEMLYTKSAHYRTVRAEVKEGSMWAAVGYRLVDPKAQGSSIGRRLGALYRKGSWLILQHLDVDSSRQRNWTWRRRRGLWEEFPFLVPWCVMNLWYVKITISYHEPIIWSCLMDRTSILVDGWLLWHNGKVGIC